MAVREILTAVFLGILAVVDMKKKRIPLVLIMVMMAIGGVGLLGSESVSYPDKLGSMALGAALCVFAVLCRGSIGVGDGWAAVLLGICEEFTVTLVSLCLAFFLAALWALMLMLVKKAGRKARFAFVPFLFAGFLISLWLRRGGAA